jgi:hypothetical protein
MIDFCGFDFCGFDFCGIEYCGKNHLINSGGILTDMARQCEPGDKQELSYFERISSQY